MIGEKFILMEKIKNIVKIVTPIIILIVIILLAIYNFFTNDDFLQMSLVNLITLSIAIILSYLFVEKNNNIRKRKEVIETIIEKIQLKLESNIMININDESDIKKVSINKRSIDNNLNLLKNKSYNLGIEKDIEYIMEQFENYISIIDNHIADIPYIRSSKTDLERYLMLMCDKLDKVRMNLY